MLIVKYYELTNIVPIHASESLNIDKHHLADDDLKYLLYKFSSLKKLRLYNVSYILQTRGEFHKLLDYALTIPESIVFMDSDSIT